MKDRYRITDYNITSDPQFWIDQYNITPELEREMPELEAKAIEGELSVTRKFHAFIEKYPHNPKLKNLLSALYMNAGQQEKAEEVNRWIETEHPDYLYAKLNKAATYYQNEEYEKMPLIMGDIMELKEMYPERDTFYISEFLSFYKMAALYFHAIGDIDQAHARLELMMKVAPDHPDTEYVEDVLLFSINEKALARYEREAESRITPKIQGHPLPPQRQEAPVLMNAESYKLFSKGWGFTEEEIQELLQLPRESFIADLELLLDDAKFRFQYFHEQFEEEEVSDNSNFPIHALLFLGELKAEDRLTAILDFLRYEEEFLNFWLGDTLTEIFWQVIYKTGQAQPEKLRDFLLEPNLDTFSKTPASQALSQIALHQPVRRSEILNLFRSVLNGFARAEPGDGLLDSEVTGFIVADLLNINARELEPEIKKLYELGYVGEGICGPWEDVEISLKSEKPYLHDVLSLQEQYKWLQELADSWDREPESYFEDNEDDDFWPDFMDQEFDPSTDFNTPIVKPRKVGRNEPCPCGSGKKYKKCCW